MKTIRRIYIYLVTFISFILTAWAIIGLLRSIFDTSSIGGNTTALAQALSMIVVGGIVFWIHWGMAQKDASEDMLERLSSIRAIFLYGIWASFIIPIAQNFLAIFYRGLSGLFNVSVDRYGFMNDQIFSDNLIAIAVNAILAAYVYTVMKEHWQKHPQAEVFITTRRLFRYLWKLYGLGLVLMGFYSLLSYLLNSFGVIGFGATRSFIWGLSYLILGLPIFIHIWQVIIDSTKESVERESLLRQVILYSLTLLAAIFSLTVVGIFLSEFLQTLFIAKEGFRYFLSDVQEALSLGIPASIAWAYFNSVVKQDRAADPHITRRSGMRRLNIYVLSFLGIATTFIGLEMLVVFLADVFFDGSRMLGSGWQSQLINIFSMLVIGIPVWLKNWLPMNAEAAEESEAGDHARRSLNRKVYLYVLLFIGVIGIMFITGSLLFLIISTLLGAPPDDIAHFLTQVVGSLAFLSLLTTYHWRQLRADNSASSISLIAQHADYSVLIFEPANGEFSEALLAEFREQVPEMPVTVYGLSDELDDFAKSADAVILPASLLTNLKASQRIFLEKFSGTRVVVPDAQEGWLWIGSYTGKAEKLIKKAVQEIEKISEKQTFTTQSRSPWVYIAIGLIGLPTLCGLVSFIAETAF